MKNEYSKRGTLIEQIEEIKAIELPIPVDKEANIRMVVDVWAKEFPFLKDVTAGKTTTIDYVSEFAEDLKTLKIFNKHRLVKNHDTELLRFINKALYVVGYTTGRCSWPISVTEKPERPSYIGAFFSFCVALFALIFAINCFLATFKGEKQGLIVFGFLFLLFSGIFSLGVWFSLNSPFEYNRELVPTLLRKAKWLDEVIKDCYKK